MQSKSSIWHSAIPSDEFPFMHFHLEVVMRHLRFMLGGSVDQTNAKALKDTGSEADPVEQCCWVHTSFNWTALSYREAASLKWCLEHTLSTMSAIGFHVSIEHVGGTCWIIASCRVDAYHLDIESRLREPVCPSWSLVHAGRGGWSC